jgi:hypothetical protein
MPISGQFVEILLREVKFCIDGDPELLSCFGSFFLAADGRGMKLATKQCTSKTEESDSDSSHSVDFTLIQEQFSDLDWDQMLDRSKGELYLDLGISYHSSHTEPLVGLWRLPSLQRSFQAMGFKKGTTHHMNTLGFYGGMKAEMKLRMKEESLAVSRVAYNLIFEVIRNPGAMQYFCEDKDLIGRSDKFSQAQRNWINLLQKAKTRSFGVRDEVRGLAGAVLYHLPNAANQASL